MKLIYPALFHHENGSYWVEFPDLVGCQSFGDTIEETYSNAKEALCGYCVALLEQQKKLNPASNIQSIKTDKNTFVSLIEINLADKSKCVKKTLTIPSWLNDIALEQNINFSQTLTDALCDQLHIK